MEVGKGRKKGKHGGKMRRLSNIHGRMRKDGLEKQVGKEKREE